MSDFIAPPEQEEYKKLADMIGSLVVIVPVEYDGNTQTRFGPRPSWNCTIWELKHDDPDGPYLAPEHDMRMFQKGLVAALTTAKKANSQVAGMVVKHNNGAKVTPGSEQDILQLAELWKKTCEANPEASEPF